MKKLYILILILLLPLAYAETSSSSINWASRVYVDQEFCHQNGVCNLSQANIVNSTITIINTTGGIFINGTPIDDLYVNVVGDTMRGDLEIRHSSNPKIRFLDTDQAVEWQVGVAESFFELRRNPGVGVFTINSTEMFFGNIQRARFVADIFRYGDSNTALNVQDSNDVSIFTVNTNTPSVTVNSSNFNLTDDGNITASGQICDSNGCISDGIGDNPFDQDLNTTSNVTFNILNITGNISFADSLCDGNNYCVDDLSNLGNSSWNQSHASGLYLQNHSDASINTLNISQGIQAKKADTTDTTLEIKADYDPMSTKPSNVKVVDYQVNINKSSSTAFSVATESGIATTINYYGTSSRTPNIGDIHNAQSTQVNIWDDWSGNFADGTFRALNYGVYCQGCHSDNSVAFEPFKFLVDMGTTNTKKMNFNTWAGYQTQLQTGINNNITDSNARGFVVRQYIGADSSYIKGDYTFLTLEPVLSGNRWNTNMFGQTRGIHLPFANIENATGILIESTADNFIAINASGDIYVKGNLTAGAIALGSNSLEGLSEGDINSSTVYYDALTAKSPEYFKSNSGMEFDKYGYPIIIECKEDITSGIVVGIEWRYDPQTWDKLTRTVNSMAEFLGFDDINITYSPEYTYNAIVNHPKCIEKQMMLIQ